MVDTHHYIFDQTHSIYSTKSELKCKFWIWVIMTCHCRLISYNKCAIVVGNADNKRTYACVGA